MAIPSQRPRTLGQSIGRLWPALLLIGFTATVAQILLMRELLVVFHGNEMSLGILLASWLFWTSMGSRLFGWGITSFGDPRRVMAGLQIILALTLPATIFAVRSAKGIFITVPGEMPGPWPMLLTALVVLCPLCVFSGGAFSAGSRSVQQETMAAVASATGSVYLLEAIGAGIGGLLASLVLVRQYTSFQVAFSIGMFNLLSAVSLGVHRKIWRGLAYGAVIIAFLAGLIPFGARSVETLSLDRLWHGFHLLESRNSAYGNLAVVETESSRTLLENGLVIFTVPDPQTAEESVHYALLQHAAPRSVLLVGGALNGSVVEALKHPQIERVEVVELDPAIFELGQTYFAGPMRALQHDRRVRLHISDGRLFLKSTADTFDVVILNLPEPQTAQINRFYTVEFFRQAAAKLNPGGILSFQLVASENYITPARASFLRCINRSLREVFPEVSTIPGDTVHFFASKQAGTLTDQADELLHRLQARRLETSYAREYYLPFRMAPDRMTELAERIRPESATPVNRDFVPIAYYFDVALWSTQFNEHYREAFAYLAQIKFFSVVLSLTAMLLAGTVLLGVFRRRQLQRVSVTVCVATMGFTLMGLEVLLLLGFQAIYGYVYQQLALLVAAVMMGMALGSWLGLRRIGRHDGGGQRATLHRLVSIQVLAALSPVLLCAFFMLCERSRGGAGVFVASEIFFPIVALLCGMLGGYQFPLASRMFFMGRQDSEQSTGTLYAVDLLGACIGAILLSAYLIPVFGFLKTATLILVLNLATAVVAFTAVLQGKRVPA